MKILILGDLHCRQEWLSWVLERRDTWDLIAAPGDLGDIFRGNFPRQRQTIASWISSLSIDGLPVAWCSGNHDIGRWTYADPDPRERACWTDDLRGPSIVGDLESKHFSKDGQSVIVTCLPYSDLRTPLFEGMVAQALATGSALRDEEGFPWIVLSHSPPSGMALSQGNNADLGDPFLREQVLLHRPDFVFSGHVHQGPFIASFEERLGSSRCFNPGHLADASFPCHVTLDLADGSARFAYDQACRTYAGTS